MKMRAARLAEAGVPAALLFTMGEEAARVVFTSRLNTVNAGTLLGDVLARTGGRGGGDATTAQGSVPLDHLDSLKDLIRKALKNTYGKTDS